jgi:hypothetical protein
MSPRVRHPLDGDRISLSPNPPAPFSWASDWSVSLYARSSSYDPPRHLTAGFESLAMTRGNLQALPLPCGVWRPPLLSDVRESRPLPSSPGRQEANPLRCYMNTGEFSPVFVRSDRLSSDRGSQMRRFHGEPPWVCDEAYSRYTKTCQTLRRRAQLSLRHQAMRFIRGGGAEENSA